MPALKFRPGILLSRTSRDMQRSQAGAAEKFGAHGSEDQTSLKYTWNLICLTVEAPLRLHVLWNHYDLAVDISETHHGIFGLTCGDPRKPIVVLETRYGARGTVYGYRNGQWRNATNNYLRRQKIQIFLVPPLRRPLLGFVSVEV